MLELGLGAVEEDSPEGVNTLQVKNLQGGRGEDGRVGEWGLKSWGGLLMP